MMDLERASPSAAHWPKELYESVFPDSARSSNFYRLAWAVDDSRETPLESSAQVPGILAFLVARRLDSDWELEDIVVSEATRRRGAGSLLLASLIAEARAQKGSGIFLEVRESNLSARALYKKAGFKEMDLRKGYYSDPMEDAVVCRLSLFGEF
jgi:ribosomal-protein-alanine N-acetyltransferase